MKCINGAPWVVAVVVVLGSLWSVCPAEAQVSVESLTGSDEVGPHYQDVEDAIKRFSQRDYDSARKLLEEARKKTPSIAPSELLLSQLFFASNQRPLARAELDKAMKHYPNDPEPYLILGDVAFGEGRYTEAGLLYQKAADVARSYEENPKRKRDLQIKAHAGAAAVLETGERWAEAREHLNAWAKLDPKKAAPHQRLGRVLFKLGKRRDSFKELQLASLYDAKLAGAEVMMATLLSQAQESGNAQKWIEEALKKGKDAHSKLAIAQLLMQAGSYKQAATQADDAVRLDPESVEAKIVRGMAARMLGDYKTAARYFEAAHLQSPTNFLATNQLALALIEQPEQANHKRALEYAELNARLNPKNAEAIGALGWVQYRMGRTSDADRNLGMVASTGTFSGDTAFFVATMLRDQGRTAAAVKLLDSALSSDRPFAYRAQAQQLRGKLNKESSPKAGAGPETP